MKFDGKKPVNPHIFAELKRLAIELWRTYDAYLLVCNRKSRTHYKSYKFAR